VVLAVGDNDLGGALDVDSNGVLEVWVLDSSDRSLQLGVEGDLGQNPAFFACHDFVDGNFSILEPLDE